MLAAMAKNAPNAGALLNSANAIGKTKRVEDLKFDESDPVSYSQKFLRTMSGFPLDRAEVMGFFAESNHLAISEDEAKTATRTLRKAFSKADLPVATLLDIGIANARISFDGDKEVALRVNVFFTPQMHETHFLVLEKGKWKIAATNEGLFPLGAMAREHALAGRLTAARQLLDWAHELTPAAQAEDPVQGWAFSRLWERGKEASLEEILTAAAALSTRDTKAGDWTIDQLRKARALASEPAKRAPIDAALIQVLENQKRWDEAAELSLGLHRDFPRSVAAFAFRMVTLTQAKKFADIRELAQSRLKLFAEDPAAIRALARVAEYEGDFKTQRAELARLEKRGVMTSQDLNGLIWDTLMDKTTNAETVELALRISQMAPDSFPELHSAAAVMAQQGKTNEAQSFLIQAMQAAGMDEPEENCWLVLGQIADQLGLKDVAKARYALVRKPEGDGPGSHLTSYALAQRWMAESK